MHHGHEKRLSGDISDRGDGGFSSTDIQSDRRSIPSSYERSHREGKHIGHTGFSSVKTCRDVILCGAGADAFPNRTDIRSLQTVMMIGRGKEWPQCIDIRRLRRRFLSIEYRNPFLKDLLIGIRSHSGYGFNGCRCWCRMVAPEGNEYFFQDENCCDSTGALHDRE